MKLHTKLVLSLLSGLIIFVVITQFLQHYRIIGLISELSQASTDLMRQREEQSARNIHTSADRAIAGSLERGEMEKFSRLLEEQRDVKGLLEFSLFSPKGKVTHSS